jgi:subtilisin family serine protease
MIAAATMRLRTLANAAALMLCASAGLAQPPDQIVHIRTGDVHTQGNPNALSQAAFAPGRHMLVFDGPLDPARLAALNDAGVVLNGYLPTNAQIADLSKTTPARVRALPFVTWVGPYHKEWKIDPDLAKGAHGIALNTPARKQLADKGQVAAYIWLFQGEAAPAFQAELKKLGAQVNFVETVADRVCLTVVMAAKDLRRLADLPQVQFAEHVPEYAARNNSVTRWVVQSDQPSFTPLYDHGITGVGQIIGIIDGAVAYTHCSFLDPVNPIGPNHRKVVAYNDTYLYSTYGFHGTHCAATAAGDAGDTTDTRGVAYGARIVFNTWPSTDTASHYQHYLLHYQQGACVHSNSWGTDSTRAYDTGCVGIDSFQYDHDDNLLIFAVTDGNFTPNFQVTNPENAKNSLAVTASGEYPSESSRCMCCTSPPEPVGGVGPTMDGRRKPEVAAPGCNIVSAYGDGGCLVATASGTSMACPAVAGTAALIRQYFTSGYYPSGVATPGNAFIPSGPLIKAMLVNSAVDMTGVTGFPSDIEGWGRIQADNAVYFDGQRKLLISDVRNASTNALQTGQTVHVSFWAENCNLPLKITLAYHDYPALANAALAPVNNLDLVVTSPNGQIYYGNNFVGGVSVPGGSPDPLNNLEQVLIPSAMAGHWDVAIVGAAVNNGPQGYAVVITGAVDQNACAGADFNCDGDIGTDADIEAFFRVLAGAPGDADFNRDGDIGTDADIEAFFRVLAGLPC